MIEGLLLPQLATEAALTYILTLKKYVEISNELIV